MASKTGVPAFEETPVDSIPKIAATVRETFRSQKTKSLEFRKVQLRKLYWGILDNTAALEQALYSDLGKSKHEAHIGEIDWVLNDIPHALKNLDKWAKDDTSVEVKLTFQMLKPRLRKEPFGAVLIIGTYNLPSLLTLGPLIGAIAAGNTVVIKPSEVAPATAMVMRRIVEDYLDPSAVKCVNGAIPQTSALLEEKWEKIFYTGSAGVAKIISKKAAETLTPVVLELGGRNPAFVSKDADLWLAARRLAWGKCFNAGQVCLSQNYVNVDKAVVDDFIKLLKATYAEFYPKGAKNDPEYGKIINTRHFDRIKNMLDKTAGKIVIGGQTDRDRLYIEPSVVLLDPSMKDDIMLQEESFGPIYSIVPYDTLDQAINLVNDTDSTPLAVSTFGTKAQSNKILGAVTSGGATINDNYMHGSVPTMPFGGVGQSGTGAYHGKYSFDAFSHQRPIVETPGWMDKLLRVRYAPYLPGELKQYQWINGTKPDFDRDGKQLKGLGYWAWLILGLGGPSTKGALFRWLIVLVSGYAAVYGMTLKPLTNLLAK